MGQMRDDGDPLQKLNDQDWVVAHSRLEAHYFSNDLFMKPGQLMEEQNLAKIRHIPSKSRYHPQPSFTIVIIDVL